MIARYTLHNIITPDLQLVFLMDVIVKTSFIYTFAMLETKHRCHGVQFVRSLCTFVDCFEVVSAH